MLMRRLMAALIAVLLLTGCDRVTPADGPQRPVSPAWAPLTLPVPPGPPGRLLLRAVATCAGRWYVAGGVVDPAGNTRPAAWVSTDGATFTALTLVPSSFSGGQHVLSAVACRERRVAAVGSKSGGVHGNPRVGTWSQASDGALHEVSAPFEQFGGPQAVSVGRLAAGPPGWLLVGSRVSGAAVWVSPDSTAFTLVEGAPELAGDERGRTVAHDAVAVPSGWLVVGSLLAAGGSAPLVWTSADGRAWRRAELPGGPGEAHRVVLAADAAVAVGLAGPGFAVWRADGDGWVRGGEFGSRGSGVRSVADLVVNGPDLVVLTRAAGGHELWRSADSGHSWRLMTMPVVVPDSGDTAVAMASAGDRLLLVADDAAGSGVWHTTLSAPDR